MKPLEYYFLLPYTTLVSPEECTDGSWCYFARCPELPGCESHGDTPDEARANLEEARRLFLQSMLDDGVEPPEPVALANQTSGPLTAIWEADTGAEARVVDAARTETWEAPRATFATA